MHILPFHNLVIIVVVGRLYAFYFINFEIKIIFLIGGKKVIKKEISNCLYLVAGILFFICGVINGNSTFFILGIYFTTICIVEKNNDDKDI